MKVVGQRPGFPAVLKVSNADSTLGAGSSSQVHGNVHLEQNRPRERLENRKKRHLLLVQQGKKIAANSVRVANSSIQKMMWCYNRIGASTMWLGDTASLHRTASSHTMQLV